MTDKEERIVVVNELPNQPMSKVQTESGEVVNLITINEALTEMFNDIKAIRKAVA